MLKSNVTISLERRNLKMKRYFLLAGLIIIFFTAGCSSLKKSGKLRIQSRHEKVNLDYLVENWKDFHIYYDGTSAQDPWAMLFDPKKDDRKIVADPWVEVVDQQQLKEVYTWMDSRWKKFTKLYRVLGPDDQLYGYMYAKRKNVNIRAVDENTLWVDNFPHPFYRYGP
jgi:hypothetical protein